MSSAITAVRIATARERPPARSMYPSAPVYTPRAQGSSRSMSSIARSFGVSEAVIGLTLVALGTSLPELVTSVLAARRGHGDVALGNILGSNIFNVLGILGATALAKPLPVAPMIAQVDVYVMLAASLALLATGLLWQRISRAAGLALLLGYAVYIGWLSRTLL